MDLPRMTNQVNRNVMYDASFERQLSPGICVPYPLPPSEYEDIERCFNAVNKRVVGYLDLMELKEYMELRGCPITRWEGEKILEHSDPTYHYYISLRQVIDLAVTFGIGTRNPMRLTRSEFEIAIQDAFTPSSDSKHSFLSCSRGEAPRTTTSSKHNFNNVSDVVTYFETRFAEEEIEDPSSEDEEAVEEYAPSYIKQKTWRETRDVASQTEYIPLTPREILNFTYPKKNDSVEGVTVIKKPLDSVRIITGQWERRIQDLIRTNGDDFLVKLGNQPKLVIQKKKETPKTRPTKDVHLHKTPPSRRHQRTSSFLSLPPTPIIKSLYRNQKHDSHRNTQQQPASKDTQRVYDNMTRKVGPGPSSLRNRGAPPPLPPPILSDDGDGWD